MKTILIQLERHDDLISIRDRMAWAKGPRVLLVWPRRGRVGIRPLDLVLLRRHAAAQGAQLGLVTRNQQMRAAARGLNLPCFKSAAEAQKKDWPENAPVRPVRRFLRMDLRAARKNLPGNPLEVQAEAGLVRLGIFSLGVLALLAVMLVFVPSARIRIAPPDQVQRTVISVSAAPGVKGAQLSGAVPMQILSETLEMTDTALATGQINQPEKTAQGRALFTNLTQQTVSVPAGTVLLTRDQPPVAFVTQAAAEIPVGKKAAQLVDLRAVQPGSAANVPAGAIGAFEGPLGLTLQVTNPEPTSGGSDLLVSAPAEQDWAALRARLLGNLERQARVDFSNQASTPQDGGRVAGNLLLPSTFRQVKILAESASPAPGQPGAKLTLTLKVEYACAYLAESDLEALAALVLDAALPAGSVPAPGTLQLKSVSELAPAQESIHWQMQAERQVRQAITPEQIIPLVTGKTAQQAEILLVKTFGLKETPEISILPIWWPWLPFLPMQITVVD